MKLIDYFPARIWLATMSIDSVRKDAFAGFTNAAIVLPQGVAFATIAGLPAEYGLYTAMITAVIAAIFGSSMIMISGPTTAISAILFTTLSDFATPNTQQYIELALMLTILVGVFQIAAGLGRLGGLVSFVSHSVMTAFTAAAALLIAVSQLAGAMELHIQRGGNVFERLLRLFEHINETNGLAILIGLTTLISAIVFQKLFPRIPGFLFALLIGSGLAWLLDAANKGVSMVGSLPEIIPTFSAPSGVIGEISTLAPGAVAIALVGLLEAISIGRAFAARRGETFDANQEMIGQGLSNFIGGFFQCYAGSGSFTRSGVNATSGAVSPLSGIFSSIFLALILVFVAPLVSYIPTPAMSGLILFVAWKLIDIKELRHIITSKSPETIILLLTLSAGLFIELDFAIYVGVIASLCVFVYESAHPDISVMAPLVLKTGERKFRDSAENKLDQCPQLLTISLDGPLFFGSVEHIEREIKKIRQKNPRQKHMILYLKGVGKIDLAGADLLVKLIQEIKDSGGSFRIVAIFPPLLKSLKHFHVIDILGKENILTSKGDAISAATKDLNPRICKGCLFDVFNECDTIRDSD